MSSRNSGNGAYAASDDVAGTQDGEAPFAFMARGGGATRGRPFARLSAALEAERAQWFYWVPVVLGCGMAVYFALPYEPSPLTAGLVLAAVAVARLALPTRAPMPLVRLFIDILMLAALGFCLVVARAQWVGAPVLDVRMGPVEVRGFVELIEPREGRGERLTLWVTRLGNLDAAARPERVRVRTMVPGDGIKPGDALIVHAHLAPPSGPALPGGFDFARHAYFAGIGAVGYALTKPEHDTEAGAAPLPLRVGAAVEHLRRAIGARVERVLSGEAAAIAKALVTGERGGIPEATNAAYRDSGLFHILSISGLHMAVMGGAVFFAVRFILALFPALVLRYPVKKWAALAAALGSLGYLAISGTSFATVRSFIMISIMFVAILLDRPAIALRNVALAALIILVMFPESLLDVGFQMSFAAVVALVAVYEVPRMQRAGRRVDSFGWVGMAAVFLGGIIFSTVIASAAVTPFAVYHFHKTQHYAVLANLVAVPICDLVVMPAALATLVLMPFGLEAGPLQVMGLGIDAMSAAARFVAGLPGAVGMLPAIPTHAFTLMLAGGLWLCLWQGRWRLGGLIAICAGLAAAPFAARPDVLVGRDGRLVAVRAAGGGLVALSAPQSQFELKRWLEHDGDARLPGEAVAAAGLTCDSVGCGVSVRHARIAISRHAASVVDDCELSDLLVLAVPVPKGCAGPARVIDTFDVRRDGTHAVYIDGPRQMRVVTVASERGLRPWSSLAGRRNGSGGAASGKGQGGRQPRGPRVSGAGVGRYAAPLDMLDALRLPRAEIEDDAGVDLAGGEK